jgi:folate-dependent phosphoribosylglycinamide formyltransferase PurN
LHKKREKVAGKTIVLLTTVVLCLLRMSVAYPQVDTARSAEDSQQSESPQLSLADLDALIEDDADEDLAEVIRGQIFDLLVLSGFLSLALVSFFKNSSTL